MRKLKFIYLRNSLSQRFIIVQVPHNCAGATQIWLDTRQHSGHSTTMDFMFALSVPISIAGESVASRVSVSLLAGMCDENASARLLCGLVARNIDDYGVILRRVMRMTRSQVCV